MLNKVKNLTDTQKHQLLVIISNGDEDIVNDMLEMVFDLDEMVNYYLSNLPEKEIEVLLNKVLK